MYSFMSFGGQDWMIEQNGMVLGLGGLEESSGFDNALVTIRYSRPIYLL